MPYTVFHAYKDSELIEYALSSIQHPAVIEICSRLNTLSTEISAIDDIDALQAEADDVNKQNDDLHSEIEELTERINDLECQVCSLEQELEDAQSQVFS